jgi:hypothetical protein
MQTEQPRGRGRPRKQPTQNEVFVMDDISSKDSGSETTTPEELNTGEVSHFTIETIREPNNADVIRREQQEALEAKITDEIKMLIGYNAGFLMWEELSEQSKKKAWYEKRNANYHSCSLYIKEGLPPMLCYKRVGKGEKNEYVINLNTLKPTFNSQIKKELSKYLIDKLK